MHFYVVSISFYVQTQTSSRDFVKIVADKVKNCRGLNENQSGVSASGERSQIWALFVSSPMLAHTRFLEHSRCVPAGDRHIRK